MQLTALPCHGSGKWLRQTGSGSAIRPEPRQAIPQLMLAMLDTLVIVGTVHSPIEGVA